MPAAPVKSYAPAVTVMTWLMVWGGVELSRMFTV